MRSTPLSRRTLALLGALAPLSACAFEFSETTPRPHGSVGSEVFRIVCMNLAAQAFPNDLTGERFSDECDGKLHGGAADAGPVDADTNSDEVLASPEGEREERAHRRQRALVAQRPRLVPALDAAFDARGYQPDELRTFLANMVPLYDPPEELPELTRAAATFLEQLIDPKDEVGAEAITALERMSAREGYRPVRFDLALTRGILAYPKLDELLRATLTAVAPESGPAREPFEDLLRASALDLATADRADPDPKDPGTLSVSTRLLFSEDDAFAGDGAPVHMTLRDARGLARPTTTGGSIAAPFKDDDDDGRADIDKLGRFALQKGTPVTPYPVFGATKTKQVTRDSAGRALNADKVPLYESVDANRTLLAGVLRDAAPLLTPSTGQRAPLLEYLYGFNALIGDYGRRSHAFGQNKFSFEGPDTAKAPLFDLVHALGSAVPFEQTDSLLEIVEQLLKNHESELAGLVEAMLYIKERSDAYPDAVWEKPHEFWDDLIAWTAHVAQTPGLLESVLRSLSSEEAAKLGPLVGNFMRFKDRANYPLGKREELEALGIGNHTVLGKLNTSCQGSACGQACDLNKKCPAGLACVVSKVASASGTCGSVSEAVAAHRMNVNYPCTNPPGGLFGSDPGAKCRPRAPLPAKHHRGIRDCPTDKPADGASCSDVGGLGLCSWDQGSCTCACEGGLCRHGAKPVWTCTDEPTPGYAEWVDRTQPDNRVGADGQTNQSLFQRTVALVHDLHVPTVMCNKQDARVVLYNPGGSNTELIPSGFNPLLAPILGTLLGPYDKCDMLKEDHIVRYYLRSVLGYGGVEIQNEALRGLMDDALPIFGIEGDVLMERQYQIRGFNLGHPTPEGIARMVFSPYNAFQDGVTDLVTSRDGTAIMDLHQDTIIAWELKDPISGASYLEALVPLLKALDPNGEKDDGYIDLFADVLSIVHKHWPSRKTDATQRACDTSTPPVCDEKANVFAYQSNGVSFEELSAEALLDAQLLARVRAVMVALTESKTSDGRDGITVLSATLQNMLLPERSCVGGDCTAHPLAYRDGKTSTTTNTGKPVDAVSPIYLVLDALNAIDARFEGAMHGRLAPWRQGRSKLVDVFFDVEAEAAGAWRFMNPRGPALLLAGVRFLRERLAVYDAAERDCIAAGGTEQSCQQKRDWAFGWDERLASSLGQPVSAATLRLLDRFRELDTDPASKVAALLVHLNTEAKGDDTFAASLVGTADLLQTLQDTKNLGPLMTFVSRAVAVNATELVAGKGGDAEIQSSLVQKALKLMRSLQDVAPESDKAPSTLATLLARLAKPHDASGETPLDVIVDSIVAVNRSTPGAREEASLDASDLRDLLHETEQFLSSERHGLERLYDVVQSRNLP